MEKLNWCKILGHKWIPIYIVGWFGYEKVKFVGSECKRCNYGSADLRNTIGKMSKCVVQTYNEKYYYENQISDTKNVSVTTNLI